MPAVRGHAAPERRTTRAPPITPVAFIWHNFGPYHVDRLEATAAALAGTHRVIGIEIAGSSGTYAWARTERVEGFERRTLFPDRRDSEIPWWRQFARLARVCLGSGARHVFICHYDHLETLLLAILLRLMG